MRECTPVGEYLYRIHDTYSEIGKASGYTYNAESQTYCYRYKVLWVTDCGAWIARDGGKRFVLLDAYKKFACETIELAVTSFKARKERQLRILRAQINRITDAKESVDAVIHVREQPTKELTNILTLG